MPVADMMLPQVLLGSESQLLAFVAASTAGARMFFAPMPEMFAGPTTLHMAAQRLGAEATASIGERSVHLRFGAIRSARVLKGVRNAAVIAEAGGAPPLTASHHPFASGDALPAAMRRLFTYRTDAARPHAIGGAALPVTRLPPAFITADLADQRQALATAKPGRAAQDAALDLVALPDFRSASWAAGRVGSRSAHARLVERRAMAALCVLLPWNMDHPGSIIPALLERLLRLHDPGCPCPRIVLLPFNYIGQTGIIRRLITRLRGVCQSLDRDAEAALAQIHLARVTGLAGIVPLRRLAATAWVDGNDPEHWWTLARLSACGIGCVLIDPSYPASGQPQDDGVIRVPADEAIWVEGETRCGALTFAARLPSLRMLPRLVAARADRARPQGHARTAKPAPSPAESAAGRLGAG